jgi:hypothetical protein
VEVSMAKKEILTAHGAAAAVDHSACCSSC